MNGKENIISKILSDADAKCGEILNTAKTQAEQIKANAEIAAEADKQALNTRIETLTAERVRNRVATAELDARKYKLYTKQQLISRCYDKALRYLADLPSREKQAFIAKLLKKYAENGETVCIAKADKDVITQKFLDTTGIKLTLDKKYHSEAGGVILLGAGYEKDLTLSRIVAHLREQTEGKVAGVLFGE